MIHLHHCPLMANPAGQISGERPDARPGFESWNAFRDNFPDLLVEDAKSLRNQDVALLASLDETAEIVRHLLLIFGIPGLVVQSLTLVLPFLPMGTMERVDRQGQVATAPRLARIISPTPFMLSGPTHLFIFDIHARQARCGGHGPACPVSTAAA